MQYGMQWCAELYIVWNEPIIVAEITEFEEPILLYQKGTVFNLYQILMGVHVPFNYRAVGQDEFDMKYKKAAFETEQHQVRKDRISFNEHRFKPNDFPKSAKEVQLYTVERSQVIELLD